MLIFDIFEPWLLYYYMKFAWFLFFISYLFDFCKLDKDFMTS